MKRDQGKKKKTRNQMQKSEDPEFEKLYQQWHQQCLDMKNIPFFRDYEAIRLQPLIKETTTPHVCMSCHKEFSCENALQRHRKQARTHMFWSWFQQYQRI